MHRDPQSSSTTVAHVLAALNVPGNLVIKRFVGTLTAGAYHRPTSAATDAGVAAYPAHFVVPLVRKIVICLTAAGVDFQNAQYTEHKRKRDD